MALVGFGLNNAERLFLKAITMPAPSRFSRRPMRWRGSRSTWWPMPSIWAPFPKWSAGSMRKAQMPPPRSCRIMALMLRLCLPVAALLVALRVPDYDLCAAGRLPWPCRPAVSAHRLFVLVHQSDQLRLWQRGACAQEAMAADLANAMGSVRNDRPVAAADPAAWPKTARRWRLPGGTLISLVACIIISERLTHVPVPWRDIGFRS